MLLAELMEEVTPPKEKEPSVEGWLEMSLVSRDGRRDLVKSRDAREEPPYLLDIMTELS